MLSHRYLVLLSLRCIISFMRPFAEQTILVTGATNGLGLALAQALAEAAPEGLPDSAAPVATVAQASEAAMPGTAM